MKPRRLAVFYGFDFRKYGVDVSDMETPKRNGSGRSGKENNSKGATNLNATSPSTKVLRKRHIFRRSYEYGNRKQWTADGP